MIRLLYSKVYVFTSDGDLGTENLENQDAVLKAICLVIFEYRLVRSDHLSGHLDRQHSFLLFQ